MLDALGIPHFGVLEVPNDKFIPTKHVLPGEKAPWDQMISIMNKFKFLVSLNDTNDN